MVIEGQCATQLDPSIPEHLSLPVQTDQQSVSLEENTRLDTFFEACEGLLSLAGGHEKPMQEFWPCTEGSQSSRPMGDISFTAEQHAAQGVWIPPQASHAYEAFPQSQTSARPDGRYGSGACCFNGSPMEACCTRPCEPTTTTARRAHVTTPLPSLPLAPYPSSEHLNCCSRGTGPQTDHDNRSKMIDFLPQRYLSDSSVAIIYIPMYPPQTCCAHPNLRLTSLQSPWSHRGVEGIYP
jgi:hypothetical protein